MAGFSHTYKVGSTVMVRYQGDGSGEWHERLILAHVIGRPRAYIILTPDNDFYAETNGISEDIAAMRACASVGSYPIGIKKSSIYGFSTYPTGIGLRDVIRQGTFNAAGC